MHPIRTARLRLQPLTTGHAPAMFEVLRDPELYRYLDFGPPPSVEHMVNVYAELERRTSPDGNEQWLNWILCTQEPIGFVQATIRGDDAEIAYVLGCAHWGHGYAFEAVSAVLASLTDVRRFYARVDGANERSIHLLERLGFAEIAGVVTTNVGERVFGRAAGARSSTTS